MGAIEDIYADLEADVSEEEFREAVESKVEQMGGLADEETAAMLIAHELRDEEVNGVADVEPSMEEAKFLAKVVRIGDLRTFERDDPEAEDGTVLNAEVADETGSIRVTFWDEQAQAADADLEVGQVLRIGGRPKEGLNGVEVSVDRAEPDPDEEVDVQVQDSYRVEDLSLGLSDVTLQGRVLQTDEARTFDRDDGSEGKVANLLVGDETGRIRVTLWDEQADRAAEIDPETTVEIVDGYVRERDGALELHVGNRGAVEEIDDEVEFVPESTPIDAVEIDQTVDIAGVVRSADPKRTFDRDDGSEGQVRNIRVQDASGDIRVALWGDKADAEVGPGDEVFVADVEIQDGWQDDLEASAGWRSTLIPLQEGAADAVPSAAGAGDDGDAGRSGGGLDAFASDDADDGDAPPDGDDGAANGAADGDAAPDSDGDGATAAATDATGADADGDDGWSDGETVEFTGVVVQAGDPIILDDGTETLSVATDADVTLGQEVTVRGTVRDGRLDATDVL